MPAPERGIRFVSNLGINLLFGTRVFLGGDAPKPRLMDEKISALRLAQEKWAFPKF